VVRIGVSCARLLAMSRTFELQLDLYRIYIINLIHTVYIMYKLEIKKLRQ
jgi:hypothetical protein